MKLLALIPIAVSIVSAGGLAACRAIGANPHVNEMLASSGASLLVTLLAATPLILTRGTTQASVAQAALAGTLIHLFGHAATAATVMLFKLPLHDSFTYWLMAQYWVTLMALAIVCVRFVKLAPPTSRGAR